ncbi:hypothetical protein [Microbulbifer variabilis]|uniref:hypothetical protein n=1 Tax=Microbulbifer variabilis TaxID=266805 RepID=UPI001CFDCC9E|nr:hypothetical protein [Microbulbifer variabilis]
MTGKEKRSSVLAYINDAVFQQNKHSDIYLLLKLAKCKRSEKLQLQTPKKTCFDSTKFNSTERSEN